MRIFSIIIRAFLLGPTLFLISAQVARAELAAVKLLTAPLVTPSSAWAYYGAATTHTTGAAGWTSANRPAEIKELARALSRDGAVTGDAYALAVADYIHDNIAIEFRFGLSKGARGAVIDQSGTAFDQAHLMVELLREKGAVASYQLGTITLSASQFQIWTGLTDARAACQYLADGGIPATVNGATSCSGLSGSINASGVTLAHIWVSTGGKLYNPAYKAHLWKSGIDLAAALGCGSAAAPTCGSAILNLVPAPSLLSGTSNVYKIQNVPEASINSQLTTYANNLEAWIRNYNANNNTVLAIEDIVGGKEIDPDAAFAPGASLPYASTVQYAWSGEIPDQYRSRLRVQFDNIDQTLFVDEIAGKRLRVWGNAVYAGTVTPYTRTTALYAEYKPLQKSTRVGATTSDAVVTLTADHPYAAGAGTYMDEVAQRTTAFGAGPYVEGVTGGERYNVMTILNGWGNAGRSAISHFSALLDRDTAHMVADAPSSPDHVWLEQPYSPTEARRCVPSAIVPADPVFDPGCYEQHQAITAATWLAQITQIGRAQAAVANSLSEYHHSLGTILSGEGRPQSLLNVETSLSVISKVSNAGQRQSAYLGIAADINRAEGGVFEQVFDSWDGGSAVSFLVKSNAKGYATLWVDNSNSATALANVVNYTAQRIAIINDYINDGHAIIVPSNGELGEYSYSPNQTMGVSTNSIVGFRSTLDRVAYLTSGELKGGFAAAAANPTDAAMKYSRDLDYSLNRRKFWGVNLDNGDFTLSPAPDLITGAGDFPFSLPFQRSYSSSGGAEGLIIPWNVSGTPLFNSPLPSPSISGIGAGWKHNFDVFAQMSSDGFKGMGSDNPLEATAMLASQYTMAKLNEGAAAFRSHMATIFVSNWWMEKLQSNTVIVRQGARTKVFTRLPSGEFNAEPGSSEKLVQLGARVFKGWSGSFGSNFSYNGVQLSLTGEEGDIIGFGYPTSTSYNLSIAAPTSWIFSNGVRVNFVTALGVYNETALSGIYNSLGRSLVMTTNPSSGYLGLSQVTDDNGRQLFITSLVGGAANPGGSPYNSLPDSVSFTGPAGVTKYDYLPRPTSAIERAYGRISKWYTPSSGSTPYIVASYDSLYRAKTVTDNLSHGTDYFVTGINGSEEANRGEARDPLGNVSKSVFGTDATQTAQIDPLGRKSIKKYDSSGRLVREEVPEGNAIEYQYDVRNNKIRECQIAKGATPLGRGCVEGSDLVTKTFYVEGPAVRTCSNYKICNKPSYVIDPRGNRTDYTWSGVHGQLLTETKPADASGVRPETTYGYTAFPGVDGGTFYLVTSKQEKIDATNMTTTTWAYNTANKFTLKEQVVDSGGLSLRTCFTFDAIGNLISKTEPRAGLVSCP